MATDGCLLPNNVLYTTGTLIFHNLSDTYSRGGTTVSLASNYCAWTPSSGTRCYVCAAGLGCTDTPTEGIRANFIMVACPLDDYVPLIIMAFGILGFLQIKKIESMRQVLK